jgi:hypothetical protein
MFDGARQSPRGDNEPPCETLGPFGIAERWTASRKQRANAESPSASPPAACRAGSRGGQSPRSGSLHACGDRNAIFDGRNPYRNTETAKSLAAQMAKPWLEHTAVFADCTAQAGGIWPIAIRPRRSHRRQYGLGSTIARRRARSSGSAALPWMPRRKRHSFIRAGGVRGRGNSQGRRRRLRS